MDAIYIREAADSDLNDVLSVERLAFSQDDEAELVRNLLDLSKNLYTSRLIQKFVY